MIMAQDALPLTTSSIRDRIKMLIRLARAAEDDSERGALLDMIEDLTDKSAQLSHVVTPALAERPEVQFPLEVHINTPKGVREGELFADGSIALEGRRYDNPSAAATGVLGYRTNGWRVWRFRLPMGDTKTIEVLKNWGVVQQ